jgi:prophage antirepressor-like protein
MIDRLIVFKGKVIRRTLHNNAWWFSVIDVVGVLSESSNPKRYWSVLKRKLRQDDGSGQPYDIFVRLKLSSADGKKGRPISFTSSLKTIRSLTETSESALFFSFCFLG